MSAFALLALRWLHVISGAAWLGHLYVLNFAVFPLGLAAWSRNDAAAAFLRRAIGWIRVLVLLTILSGLALFAMVYMRTPGAGFGPSPLWRGEDGLTAAGLWISAGMLIAAAMGVVSWFLLAPLVERLLSGGLPEDERAALEGRAAGVLRFNAALSGPLLFCMLAPSHFGVFDGWDFLAATAVGVAAMEAALVFARRSSRAGTGGGSDRT
jgi:uncharacterized membrane protein